MCCAALRCAVLCSCRVAHLLLFCALLRCSLVPCKPSETTIFLCSSSLESLLLTADDLVCRSETKQFASLSCYKIQEREQLCSCPNGPDSAVMSGPVSLAEPGKVQSIGSSLADLSVADRTAFPLSGKATHSDTTTADAKQGSPGLQAESVPSRPYSMGDTQPPWLVQRRSCLV